MKDTIQFATPGRVAGFIHETIQGVGGSVQLADGFLSEAYQVLTFQQLSSLCLLESMDGMMAHGRATGL